MIETCLEEDVARESKSQSAQLIYEGGTEENNKKKERKQKKGEVNIQRRSWLRVRRAVCINGRSKTEVRVCA